VVIDSEPGGGEEVVELRGHGEGVAEHLTGGEIPKPVLTADGADGRR
jgi:hypothetical protein